MDSSFCLGLCEVNGIFGFRTRRSRCLSAGLSLLETGYGHWGRLWYIFSSTVFFLPLLESFEACLKSSYSLSSLSICTASYDFTFSLSLGSF